MNQWLLITTALTSLTACGAVFWGLHRARQEREATEDLLLELLQQELKEQRDDERRFAWESRQELRDVLREQTASSISSVDRFALSQAEQLQSMNHRLGEFSSTLERRIEQQDNRLTDQMTRLQHDSAKHLDDIRALVSDKLESALERRLGASFEQVNRQLEAVQKGLGEMRHLAGSVGDLKRVLTNVKTRGTWGEVQLDALLQQTLAPGQYERNVALPPDSTERVDFALCLPGDDETAPPLWLPIDAKFPLEDWQRLCDASEQNDEQAIKTSRAALLKALEVQAAAIHDKYIVPPHSTDFALLFLPVEGLYAEALRDVATAEQLQRRYRVILAGPSTLAALLNSLRMGFRALAIQQRSGEVWEILGAVKTEFFRFGHVLDKVRRQLGAVTSSIEETGRRTRAMERRLVEVEQLADSQPLLETNNPPEDRTNDQDEL